MPGSTEIPNYEPDDSAWGVVAGPFMTPPAKSEQQDQDAVPRPRRRGQVVKKNSRVRSMTDEDIDRHFGSGRVVIGPVVRPKPEPELESEHDDAFDSDDAAE